MHPLQDTPNVSPEHHTPLHTPHRCHTTCTLLSHTYTPHGCCMRHMHMHPISVNLSHTTHTDLSHCDHPSHNQPSLNHLTVTLQSPLTVTPQSPQSPPTVTPHSHPSHPTQLPLTVTPTHASQSIASYICCSPFNISFPHVCRYLGLGPSRLPSCHPPTEETLSHKLELFIHFLPRYEVTY